MTPFLTTPFLPGATFLYFSHFLAIVGPAIVRQQTLSNEFDLVRRTKNHTSTYLETVWNDFFNKTTSVEGVLFVVLLQHWLHIFSGNSQKFFLYFPRSSVSLRTVKNLCEASVCLIPMFPSICSPSLGFRARNRMLTQEAAHGIYERSGSELLTRNNSRRIYFGDSL